MLGAENLPNNLRETVYQLEGKVGVILKIFTCISHNADPDPEV